MRISDWSSDVCSSDLNRPRRELAAQHAGSQHEAAERGDGENDECVGEHVAFLLSLIGECVRPSTCGSGFSRELLPLLQAGLETRARGCSRSYRSSGVVVAAAASIRARTARVMREQRGPTTGKEASIGEASDPSNVPNTHR